MWCGVCMACATCGIEVQYKRYYIHGGGGGGGGGGITGETMLSIYFKLEGII